MWCWVNAQAKEDVAPEAIAAKRQQWITQGKDQQLRKLCRTAQRYVVSGSAPAQVFWLLETDDESAVQCIVDHFGELWNIETHVVIPQHLTEAVKTTRGGG